MVNVRSHSRRTKKGKTARVRQHNRKVRPGKQRAAQRINKMHPDISIQKAKHIFDMVYESVGSDVKSDGRVAIKDFGTFKKVKTKARKARPGRNPFTGEKIMIKAKPAGTKIKFLPSKKLKKA